MTYTTDTIADILGAETLQAAPSESRITHLLTDSRHVMFPDSAAFFALTGQRHNGHRFLEELYAAGVRCFVVSETVDAQLYPGAAVLRVANTLDALQKLAAYHRRQFELPVIGITGSNGKTIVKEWLYQLLHESFQIVRSPRSYNSQVGVPLSVWQIDGQHQLGIFEAGISRVGEMAKIAPIIHCSIGVFTNIGEAHSEGFADMEEKLLEKLQLFEHAEVIVYCRDNELVDIHMQALRKRLFSWSRRHEANLRIEQVVTDSAAQETRISGWYNAQPVRLAIPFVDPASIENAIHCWAVMLLMAIAQPDIEARMRQLEPVAMRLELKEGINGSTIINDSYNSDLTSLAIALQFLAQQSGQQKRTLILSDILQSGQDPAQLYAEVAQLLKAQKVNRFIGVGYLVAHVKLYVPPNIEASFFATTEEFLATMDQMSFRQEFILLKGARRFAFERIASRLSRKVHRTTLEVDLNAMAHNLNAYHRLLRPGTRLMAMVKAAAYGSGSVEVARLLEFHKVDYLTVAYTDEGAELRQGGIRLPIMVLNPEEEAFDSLLRYNLEPEVYSVEQLKQLARYVPERENPLPIHVKFDTGMHRLGFEPLHFEELATILQSNPQLRVQSMFSHLAASEAPEHDAFTLSQIKAFESYCQWLSDSIGYKPLRHILNTSGISRFADYQMDMVRVGIGLYGVDANAEMQAQLKTVLTLKASISQIKTLMPGETVGYGRRGGISVPSRIATISIGYADGLLRLAGNGRFSVLVGGRRAPIVGGVCMDMCMVDVTDIPQAQVGHEVVIFGDSPRVEELAAALQTIPYEVFTGISPRVRRVYVQE